MSVSSRPSRLVPFTALVVVDTPPDAVPIVRKIEAAGWQTAVRLGGSEAAAATSHLRPDAIVLACWESRVDPVMALKLLAMEEPEVAAWTIIAGQGVRNAEAFLEGLGVAAVIDTPSPAEAWSAALDALEHPHGISLADELSVAPPAEVRLDDLDVGVDIAERYVVEERLGGDECVTAYRVRDVEFGAQVALKLYSGDPEHPGALDRFERAVRVGRRVRHPTLLPTLDAGTHLDRPWFTQPLVGGRTLLDELASGRPIPLGAVLSWGAQAVAGIAALHARGLAHGDIRPGNLLLGDDGVIRLVEFGPGDAHDPDLTDRGVFGLAYLPPEVTARGEEPGPATDWFALGATLRDLVKAPDAAAAGGLRLVRPELSLRAETAILTLMQADPGRRTAAAPIAGLHLHHEAERLSGRRGLSRPARR